MGPRVKRVRVLIRVSDPASPEESVFEFDASLPVDSPILGVIRQAVEVHLRGLQSRPAAPSPPPAGSMENEVG